MKVKEQGEVVLLLEGVDEEEAMGLAMKSSQEQPSAASATLCLPASQRRKP
jgi:hypothetical protein